MRLFRRFCLWLVCDSGVRLGRFAPVIFGWGIGFRGVEVDPKDEEDVK